jgi:hypothetical protein
LSNGTTGTPGYRTDDYVYLPVGVTSRTNVASHGALSANLEFDLLIHGWQQTRDSELGSGDVPATPTAPAFTVDGFTDVSFSQSRGWALRASAKYPLTRRWSAEPYYVRWHVSPVILKPRRSVNNATAQEQLAPTNRSTSRASLAEMGLFQGRSIRRFVRTLATECVTCVAASGEGYPPQRELRLGKPREAIAL